MMGGSFIDFLQPQSAITSATTNTDWAEINFMCMQTPFNKRQPAATWLHVSSSDV
jgi:hypothetical protein